MRSFSSLFHDALFAKTRVYQDENGNFKGTSTDITPWYILIGRIWGGMIWLYIILTPLLAPVYYLFARWYCKRFDDENMVEDPHGWPQEKGQILKNHRTNLIGWIIFMLWGWCSNWGQPDYSKDSTPPYNVEKSATFDPSTYVDPYKQYKETNNIR